MTAHIIDGKFFAKQLREELKGKISDCHAAPQLAVIWVGDNEASAVYV